MHSNAHTPIAGNISINHEVIIHAHPKTLDISQIYVQNERVFNECDYLFKRHKVKFSIALLKANRSFEFDCDYIREFIRLTDKLIRVDSKHLIILYTFTDLYMAEKALIRLEKTLLSKSNSKSNDLFTCTLIEKCKNEPTKTLLRILDLKIETFSSGIHTVE